MRLIISFLLMMVLAACNLANAPAETEVSIGMTVAPTNTPLPSVTAVASNTPVPTTVPVEQVSDGCTIPGGWVAYTVQSGDTLFSIAQRANTSVDSLVDSNCIESANVLSAGQIIYLPQGITTVQNPPATGNFEDVSAENIVYYLGAEVPETGYAIEIGCGTYIRQFDTGIARGNSANDNIFAGLEALFNSPIEGYRNYWQGLSVGSVGVDDKGVAHIIINGDFLTPGHCGDAEIIAQLLLIIFAEAQVQSALIIVDEMNLRQITDMSGLSGADARFTRDSIPYVR